MVRSLEVASTKTRPYLSGSGTEMLEFCPEPASSESADFETADLVLASPCVLLERRWQANADVLRTIIWPQARHQSRPSTGTTVRLPKDTDADLLLEQGWSPVSALLKSVVRGVLPSEAIAVRVADALRLIVPRPGAVGSTDAVLPGLTADSALSACDFASSAAVAIGANVESSLRPAWHPLVREEVQGLLDLEPGWDLYSARRIDARAVEVAQVVVMEAALVGCPQPSIVPMSRGGIQVEWHIRGMNIEITIPAEGWPLEVWSEDLANQTEEAFEVVGGLAPLRRLFRVLADRR